MNATNGKQNKAKWFIIFQKLSLGWKYVLWHCSVGYLVSVPVSAPREGVMLLSDRQRRQPVGWSSWACRARDWRGWNMLRGWLWRKFWRTLVLCVFSSFRLVWVQRKDQGWGCFLLWSKDDDLPNLLFLSCHFWLFCNFQLSLALCFLFRLCSSTESRCRTLLPALKNKALVVQVAKFPSLESFGGGCAVCKDYGSHCGEAWFHSNSFNKCLLWGLGVV